MKRLNNGHPILFGIVFASGEACHKECKGVLGHDPD